MPTIGEDNARACRTRSTTGLSVTDKLVVTNDSVLWKGETTERGLTLELGVWVS